MGSASPVRNPPATPGEVSPDGLPTPDLLLEHADVTAAHETALSDLNLDQVIDTVTEDRADYRLDVLFQTPAGTRDTVHHRQAVARDLDGTRAAGHVAEFCHGMTVMRARLEHAHQLRHPYQRMRWFVDAVDSYLRAVADLSQALASDDVHSDGLVTARDFFAGYTASPTVTALQAQTREVIDGLARIRYCLELSGSRVTVRARRPDDADYAATVEAAFAKFRETSGRDYRIRFSNPIDMNHVEEQILDRVGQLYPEPFAALRAYCAANADFVDPRVAAFERHTQFYLAYFDFLRPLRAAGLKFCYPQIDPDGHRLHASDSFDIALADRLPPDEPVVTNDVTFTGDERIAVVTGPNQGGKTTFARMIGQLHHLAALGLPVPGTRVRLSLPDAVFTQFERGENLADRRGKLEDDLIRIHELLQHATARSLIVFNEIFTSTALEDAVYLSRAILTRITEVGAGCVCVTFLDELATVNPQTVSYVAEVSPDDPNQRTFRIRRRPADGRAYAIAVAKRHGLTRRQLTARLNRR